MEEHEDSNHAQYRSWCSACVRGRAKANPHKQVGDAEKEEEQIPTISIDYGFFSKKQEAGVASSSKDGRSLPVLIVKDRRSKAIWSVPVPKKGVEHPYPSRKLLQILDTTGYRRVIVSRDGPDENVVKVKPPLVFSKENVDTLVTAMDEALQCAQQMNVF